MKKMSLIFIVCLVCLCPIFARSWSFSLTAGYDHHSSNNGDNSANALGFTLGARAPINEYLDFYADGGAHFGGSFKQSDIKRDDSKIGFNTHVGLIYNIPARSDAFDMGLGLGLAFARSVGNNGKGDEKIKYGFSNLGLAIHGVARFKLSDKFSLVGEASPDVYFITWDTKKKNNNTETIKMDKLGFGLSVKVGISYTLNSSEQNTTEAI